MSNDTNASTASSRARLSNDFRAATVRESGGELPQVRTSRRTFLSAATIAAAADVAGASEDPIPIIDTHLHLYDPTRPQGVPYPKVPNPPQALPEMYREDVVPLGICGGIKVEASPWIEDNLWV